MPVISNAMPRLEFLYFPLQLAYPGPPRRKPMFLFSFIFVLATIVTDTTKLADKLCYTRQAVENLARRYKERY